MNEELTQPQLLRKQADMMEMAEKYGIGHWQCLVQFFNGLEWEQTTLTTLLNVRDQAYRFALGVVEGKPVFEGDDTYDSTGMLETANSSWRESDFVGRSWNPPKPKTAMVKMPLADIEYWASYKSNTECHHDRLYDACRKALKEEK